MEIGESIAVEIMAPATHENCWFCTEQPTDHNLKNEEEESPKSDEVDTDEVYENDVANDSSVLGGRLGKRPEWIIPLPSIEGKTTAVVPAAHHLIPGNASLKKATTLHQFMAADDGVISGDIGYDVNDNHNGIWLPGSYGVRADAPDFNQKWSAYSHQDEYASLAMKTADAQFHDAHPEYSSNVKNTLESIADKIIKTPLGKCPVCGTQLSDRMRPPYGLVGRLHAVSAKHASMLAAPVVQPKFIDAGYYTSQRIKLLHTSPSP